MWRDLYEPNVPTSARLVAQAVQITAKVDYGMRAMLTLAAEARSLTAEALSEMQELPANYLAAIMNDLRRAGILNSSRGTERGYRLARAAADISATDVIVALEGPILQVNGSRPENTLYHGPARHLREIWLSLGSNVSKALDLSLDDAITGRFLHQDIRTDTGIYGERSGMVQR